jgi:hypothetical protein
MSLESARTRAEAVTDQNLAAFAGELATLMSTKEGRDFLTVLNRLVNMPNTDAADMLNRASGQHRKEMLRWIIPAARIGLSVAMFSMHDRKESQP